nr:unnamed protein product [Callosobruchus analis]
MDVLLNSLEELPKERLLKELRAILPPTKGQDVTPEYFFSALTNNVHSSNLVAEDNSVLLNLGRTCANKDAEVAVINYGVLSEIKEVPLNTTTVTFEDCHFHRATSMPTNGCVIMNVGVQRGTGHFEVVEGDVPVVTGRIMLLDNFTKEVDDVETVELHNCLKTKDIYKEMRLRGYNYTFSFNSKQFRALQDCDVDASKGHIKWEGNWVTFMDNMLQMKILQLDTRLLYVPIYIRELTVSAKAHLEWVDRNFTKAGIPPNLPAFCDKETDVIRYDTVYDCRSQACGYMHIQVKCSYIQSFV